MANISYKVTNMDRWLRAVNPRLFNAALKKNIGSSNFQNAELIRKQLRVNLQKGIRPDNARLTILVKGSNRTLWESGRMFRSITRADKSQMTIFIGIRRGDPAYEIANILYNGMSIKVSPAMRGMFFMLWLASSGDLDPSKLAGRAAELWRQQSSGWKPLRPDTNVIRIPSRDFISSAFNGNTITKQIRKNWEMAIQKTIDEVSR